MFAAQSWIQDNAKKGTVQDQNEGKTYEKPRIDLEYYSC